jgi:hypothetical protein
MNINPTATPSKTSTATPVPTNAAMPTSTQVPSKTTTPTAISTPVPTNTVMPTSTQVPSKTATPTAVSTPVPINPGISSVPHVKATIFGKIINATSGVYARKKNEQTGTFFYLNAFIDDDVEKKFQTFSLNRIPTSVGTYACSNHALMSIVLEETAYEDSTKVGVGSLTKWKAERDGGNCSIQILNVSATEISGIFTATLVKGTPYSGGAVALATNGSFRAPIQQ